MAFCVQCGEELKLEANTCPSCGRTVGMSTIGAALERQPQLGTKRLAQAALVIVLVAIAAFLATRFLKRDVLSSTELAAAALEAQPSLARVSSAGGREEGGVVLRRVGQTLLLATTAAAATADVPLRVSANGHDAVGVLVLSPQSKPLRDLAFVIVPDATALGPLVEARIALAPREGDPIFALSPAGNAAAGGRVLSFEDGPGAGTLVHDASPALADRGHGLFGPRGRLVAFTGFAREDGESLAVSASAVIERLLLHEVRLAGGGAFSEHALPLAAKTLVGVVSAGPRLEARIGPAGRTSRGQPAGTGFSAVRLEISKPGALQLLGQSDAVAWVVTLAPL